MSLQPTRSALLSRTKTDIHLTLTEFTSVAAETLDSAAVIAAKQGYRDEVRHRFATCAPWLRGWCAEGIACGLYMRGIRGIADDAPKFDDLKAFLAERTAVQARIGAYVGIGMAIGQKGVFGEEFYASLHAFDQHWVFEPRVVVPSR